MNGARPTSRRAGGGGSPSADAGARDEDAGDDSGYDDDPRGRHREAEEEEEEYSELLWDPNDQQQDNGVWKAAQRRAVGRRELWVRSDQNLHELSTQTHATRASRRAAEHHNVALRHLGTGPGRFGHPRAAARHSQSRLDAAQVGGPAGRGTDTHCAMPSLHPPLPPLPHSSSPHPLCSSPQLIIAGEEDAWVLTHRSSVVAVVNVEERYPWDGSAVMLPRRDGATGDASCSTEPFGGGATQLSALQSAFAQSAAVSTGAWMGEAAVE